MLQKKLYAELFPYIFFFHVIAIHNDYFDLQGEIFFIQNKRVYEVNKKIVIGTNFNEVRSVQN